MIAKLGGRKYLLAVSVMLGGVGFGIYCINNTVELSDAAIYWASVSAGALGYQWTNVQQKRVTASNIPPAA